MLKSKLEAFYAAVDAGRSQVGESPSRIADAILHDVFPQSYDATRSEGCDDMLRTGVIKAITRYITKPIVSERQMHMNDFAPDVLPYVEVLGKTAYLVPSAEGSDEDDETKTIGFYVPIVDLVHDLGALEKACDFLDRKAGEVKAEANKLRALLTHLQSQK